MCTIDKETVTVGFLNTWDSDKAFSLGDVYSFIGTLWNSGCGVIRLDFTVKEIESFLDKCSPIVTKQGSSSWIFNKEELSTDDMVTGVFESESRARSFDLFCRLRANLSTNHFLLTAMGYHFLLRKETESVYS